MKPTKAQRGWRGYEQYIAKKTSKTKPQFDHAHQTNLFCPGFAYHFIFDFTTLNFSFISPEFQHIVGLEPSGFTPYDFITRIHPEDVSFFHSCIDNIAEYVFIKSQPSNVLKYKANFCFRFLTADERYKLFLLQVFGIKLDDSNRLEQILGGHTDVSHLNIKNRNRLFLFGINGKHTYSNINPIKRQDASSNNVNIELTPREKEILILVTKGATTKEIADQLFIADTTVLKHRENLLKKTKSKNTPHMVARAFRNGLI